VTRGIRFAIILVLAGAGCATASSGQPDAAPSHIDAGPGADGQPGAPPKEVREMTSGGAHVTGGGMQMDIQVGHGLGQQRIGGGSFQMEGAAAVKR
jgi:hypothetical protein